MATYYVNSGAAGSNTGADWTNAFVALGSAVTAASANGDIIKVHKAHSESLSADTVYTLAANIVVVCVDKDSSDAPDTGALIGAQATNWSITVAGAFKSYWYGITFQTGTNTTATDFISFGTTTNDGIHIALESCTFNVNANNNAAATVNFGSTATSTNNSYVAVRNCTVKFTNALQSIVLRGRGEAINLTLDATSTVPTNLFTSPNTGVMWAFEGCDLSRATSTLVGDFAGNGTAELRFANCKINPTTILATQTTVLNKGGTTVWLFNCASGDTHYNMFHGDPFGSTEVSASIYANDGASYDGTNRVSWQVKTTANASFYQPYVSPWIDVYHAGTAAVTPYLECVRSGNATPYTDAEVWSQFSVQATAGSTKATVVSDRAAPLASGTAQAASSLGASDWTGEDATSAFFKIGPSASITPAEIGDVRARVVVGLANVTDLYVDPLPRGLA